MKKLLLLLLILPVFGFAQSTYWVSSPSGYTALSNPAFRFGAVTPDSLNNLLIFNPLTGRYNQIYTATQINKHFNNGLQLNTDGRIGLGGALTGPTFITGTFSYASYPNGGLNIKPNISVSGTNLVGVAMYVHNTGTASGTGSYLIDFVAGSNGIGSLGPLYVGGVSNLNVIRANFGSIPGRAPITLQDSLRHITGRIYNASDNWIIPGSNTDTLDMAGVTRGFYYGGTTARMPNIPTGIVASVLGVTSDGTFTKFTPGTSPTAYTLSNAWGISTFSFNNTSNQQVQADSSGAHGVVSKDRLLNNLTGYLKKSDSTKYFTLYNFLHGNWHAIGPDTINTLYSANATFDNVQINSNSWQWHNPLITTSIGSNPFIVMQNAGVGDNLKEVHVDTLKTYFQTGLARLADIDTAVLVPVIIMAQSNFQAKGEVYGPTITRAQGLQYNGTASTPQALNTANDPIKGNLIPDTVYKGSPIPAMALHFNQMTGRRMLFIMCAKGNTSQTAASDAGRGNWDTGGTLYAAAIARADSAIDFAKSQGYRTTQPIVIYAIGEADATGFQTSLITGQDYTNAAIALFGRVRTHYGSTTAIYIDRLGYPASGSAGFAYDTIGNRQDQLARYGYAIIGDRSAYDFPKLGLMNPNGFYAQLHPAQAGYDRIGYNIAETIVSGYSDFKYKRPPGTANMPSLVIPKQVTHLTNWVSGAQGNDGVNLFGGAGATEQRYAMIPNTGIEAGAIVFGGSDRNPVVDTINNFRYNSSTASLAVGPTAYFPVHQQRAFISVGSNADIVLEKYGSAGPNINTLSAAGTQASPTTVTSGTKLSTWANYGYTGLAFPSASIASISFAARATFTSTSYPTGIDFYITRPGTTTQYRAGYFSDNRGFYLVPNGSGEAWADSAKLVVMPEATNQEAFLVGGTNSIPAAIFRNTTTTTNKFTITPTTTTVNLESSVGLNLNTSGNQTINTGSGLFTFGGAASIGTTLKLHGYTVSTLPAGTVGMIAYVTDALTPSFGATLIGGGAIVTKAFYNGTNWVAE